MKTTPLDYLLSLVVLTSLGIADGLLVAVLLAPFSQRWLGTYHVLMDGLLFLLLFGLLAALFYRIALRLHPLSQGRYSVEDASFTYWKLLSVVEEFGRGALLPFTTVFARPLVASLFGARVGRDVAIAGVLREPGLIHIGDYAILGQNSIVSAHIIKGTRILVQEVRIDANATVGANAIISPGVHIGAGAVVRAGALVAPFTVIPPYEEWGGNPACKIRNLRETDATPC